MIPAHEPTIPSRVSLLASAKSAVLWNTGFGLFRDLLQLGVMLALVRLLTPENYGQFAMVTGIIGFINVFSSANFVAHTLQLPEGIEPDFQIHFTATLFIQAFVFLATHLVALVCAQIDTYAAIAPYLHWMSLLFLLAWPHEIRFRMLERSFSWKRLRAVHAIGLLIGAVTSLGLAWAGYGTYALIAPAVLVTLPFIWDLFVNLKWRPTWAFSWAAYRPAIAFATARIGSGALTHGRNLLELSLLTAALGFAPLGIFTRAIGLSTLLCSQVASHLGQAIYPVLARAQSREGDRSHVGDTLILAVLFVAIPAAAFFGYGAEEAVRVLYGSQWLEVIPLLPFALAFGVASALYQILYLLLLSCSRVRLCLASDALYLLGTGAALWLALPFGTQAYLGSMGTMLFSLSIGLTLVLARAGRLTLPRLLASLAATLTATLPAIAAVIALDQTLLGETAHPLGSLALSGIVFGLLYLITFRLLFRGRFEILLACLPFSDRLRRWCLMPEKAPAAPQP